jgi:hypothetical protein
MHNCLGWIERIWDVGPPRPTSHSNFLSDPLILLHYAGFRGLPISVYNNGSIDHRSASSHDSCVLTPYGHVTAVTSGRQGAIVGHSQGLSVLIQNEYDVHAGVLPRNFKEIYGLIYRLECVVLRCEPLGHHRVKLANLLHSSKEHSLIQPVSLTSFVLFSYVASIL